MWPPGRLHRPLRAPFPLSISSTSPSRNMAALAAQRGQAWPSAVVLVSLMPAPPSFVAGPTRITTFYNGISQFLPEGHRLGQRLCLNMPRRGSSPPDRGERAYGVQRQRLGSAAGTIDAGARGRGEPRRTCLGAG